MDNMYNPWKFKKWAHLAPSCGTLNLLDKIIKEESRVGPAKNKLSF